MSRHLSTRLASTPALFRRPRGVRVWALRVLRTSPRQLLVASFLLVFLLPSLAVAAYYAFYASDQFVAESRFTVRIAPPLAGKSAPAGAVSLVAQDTQIVMNYLQSRTLVDRLEREVGLRDLYSNDTIDYVSRMSPDVKIEKFLRYWRSMTRVSVQPTTGIVTFAVRAFSPEDAVKINEACLAASETIVNELDTQLVADLRMAADSARKKAADKLAETRLNLQKIRDQEAVISGEQSAASLTQLITTVRGDFLKLQQLYDTQSRYLDKSSPQLRNLRIKLAAAKNEIQQLEDRQTRQPAQPVPSALSQSLQKIDYADMENRIAEKQYGSSVALAEGARLAADSKQVYVDVFMRPALSEEARYPHRVLSSTLLIGAALATWLGCVTGLVRLRRALVSA